VIVDKKRYGDTPQIISLPAGTHTLELINNELGTDVSQKVTITSSHTTVIDKSNK
jgi:hypothetical protein